MAADVAEREAEGDGAAYRMAGAITIARAGSTSREIDTLPDPLTIDLSEVSRMDTVGAWLVYRTVRDRNAKVVGASPEITSLLDQVAEADKPVRVHPEKVGGLTGLAREIGEWVVEAGRTLVGLLGFFGATLIGFA
ncbi:MAG: ABC transporter permease, partial [Sphingomonas sp.]|nr:ABC transporter permease [Sphingomonas sp.]